MYCYGPRTSCQPCQGLKKVRPDYLLHEIVTAKSKFSRKFTIQIVPHLSREAFFPSDAEERLPSRDLDVLFHPFHRHNGNNAWKQLIPWYRRGLGIFTRGRARKGTGSLFEWRKVRKPPPRFRN